jgi:signal transduction histidine kinase
MMKSRTWSKITGFVRSHFLFRWQLTLAFLVVILLASGGILLTGRFALGKAEAYLQQNPPTMLRPWIDSLASCYAIHGNWKGIETSIADGSCGANWRLAQEIGTEYVISNPDGSIMVASDKTREGQQLREKESEIAMPIVVDGHIVGRFLLSLYGSFEDDYHRIIGFILEQFQVVVFCLVGGALIVSWLLSSLISRPVVRLMNATRAVASGDLKIRVQDQYLGELGELARSFNQMTEELALADNLRRNLTTDLAHELRTPLSVIRGKIEGFLDGVYPATPQHLEPILEETRLLSHLVEDLSLLALAEADQLDLEKQLMDVNDLLRDAQVNFGPQADDLGVTLILDLPIDLPPVLADRRRITQVLGNLLTNALRYTPRGGCVTLSAAITPPLLGERKEGITVSINDTGMGIQPQDLPYIFDRFWRGEKSRSRMGGGSGLGLAIAKQLVEMHNGKISVESEPGKGSTFRFILPTPRE